MNVNGLCIRPALALALDDGARRSADAVHAHVRHVAHVERACLNHLRAHALVEVGLQHAAVLDPIDQLGGDAPCDGCGEVLCQTSLNALGELDIICATAYRLR